MGGAGAGLDSYHRDAHRRAEATAVCVRVLSQSPEELDVAITLVHLLWEEGTLLLGVCMPPATMAPATSQVCVPDQMERSVPWT
jgi:hypothetical protein